MPQTLVGTLPVQRIENDLSRQAHALGAPSRALLACLAALCMPAIMRLPRGPAPPRLPPLPAAPHPPPHHHSHHHYSCQPHPTPRLHHHQPEVWGVKLATMLEERDLGVLLGLTTLLLGVVSRSYEGALPGRGGSRAGREGQGSHCTRSALRMRALPALPDQPAVCLLGALSLPNLPPPTSPHPLKPHATPPRRSGYEACVPRIVQLLDRLKQRDVTQDYTYYGLASPWLQARPAASPRGHYALLNVRQSGRRQPGRLGSRHCCGVQLLASAPGTRLVASRDIEHLRAQRGFCCPRLAVSSPRDCVRSPFFGPTALAPTQRCPPPPVPHPKHTAGQVPARAAVLPSP